MAGRHRHRRRPAAAAARPERAAAARHRGRVRGRGRGAGRHHPDVRHDDRAGRPEGGARAAPPPVRALPQPGGGVPRGLHLRAGDLPAGLRRRVDLRPVRGGPRLADRGRADAAARRHRDAAARLAARPGGAGRLHPADLADGLVPARVRPRLPAHQGDHRAGHRAFRRDVRRDQGGAGVPPGEAELRDLLRPGPGLRRREHARVPAHRHLRPVHLAGRQHHHRRGARLRRAARDRGQPQGRRAGDVPALPAALLRPAAGRVAVLQHLPVGGLRPGEDLRRARAGRRGARAGRARGAAAAGGAGRGPAAPIADLVSGPVRRPRPRPDGRCGSSR